MESVMNKIRQAHEEESKRQANKNITKAVVDGCQVKLRFSSVGDDKIIPVVQAMLISSRLDAAITVKHGGEAA